MCFHVQPVVNLPSLRIAACPALSTPPPPWLAILLSPGKPSQGRTTVRAPRRPAPDIRLGSVRRPAVGTELQDDYSIAAGQNTLAVTVSNVLWIRSVKLYSLSLANLLTPYFTQEIQLIVNKYKVEGINRLSWNDFVSTLIVEKTSQYDVAIHLGIDAGSI